jgi:hypothetical protein
VTGLSDLPAYVTRADLAALGFGRRAVDAICRAVPEVAIEGVRRTYLPRDAVVGYIERRTFAPDHVRAG